MGSVLPAAIDYLVANLAGPLEAVDPNVVVADNLPVLEYTSSLFTVGRSSVAHAGAIDGEVDYKVLGLQRVEEDWEIPGFIWAAGANQSAARRAAWAQWDVFVTFIRANPDLGGLLQHGRYAKLTHVAFTQPQDAADMSGGQWTATVGWTLRVPNSYVPA